jgi:hypothetical protein
LDLANARVRLPRRKTGIFRDLPLWPETTESLEKITRTGTLVFSVVIPGWDKIVT